MIDTNAATVRALGLAAGIVAGLSLAAVAEEEEFSTLVFSDNFSFPAETSPESTTAINDHSDHPGRQDGLVTDVNWNWTDGRDLELHYEAGHIEASEFFLRKPAEVDTARAYPGIRIRDYIEADRFQIKADIIFDHDDWSNLWASVTFGTNDAFPFSSGTHGIFIRPASGYGIYQADEVLHSTSAGGDGSFESADLERPVYTVDIRVIDDWAEIRVNGTLLTWGDEDESEFYAGDLDYNWLSLGVSMGSADPMDVRFANVEIRTGSDVGTPPDDDYDVPLFADNFSFDAMEDPESADDVNAHTGFSGRQDGSLAPADWRFLGTAEDWDLRYETEWSDLAAFFYRKPAELGGGWISPLIEIGSHINDGRLQISFDLIFSEPNPGNVWAGIAFGDSGGTPTSASTAGALIRPQSGWAVYEGNDAVHSTAWGGDGTIEPIDPEQPTYRVDIRIGDGVAEIYINDDLLTWNDTSQLDLSATPVDVVSLSVSQAGSATPTDVRFANLEINTVEAEEIPPLPHLVFSDNFSWDGAVDPSSTAAVNDHSADEGRQDGALAPSDWLLEAGWELAHESGWSHRGDFFLKKPQELGSGIGSPLLNADIDGDYEVEVDAIMAEDEALHWVGLSIGPEPGSPTAPETHGIYIRGTTGWGIFQAGDHVTNTPFGGDGSFSSLDAERPTYNIRMRVEDGEARFWVNGNLIEWDNGTSSIDVSGSINSYVTLSTSQSGNADNVEVRFANLAIRSAEEVEADTFEGWLHQHFDEDQRAQPVISGFDADPSGLGVPNLVSYFLGLDPWAPDRARLPRVEAVSFDDDPENEYLSIVFTRRSDVGDVFFGLDGAGELGEWEPADFNLEVLDQAAGEQTLRVWHTTPVAEAGDRFFIRLFLEL